MKLIYIFPWTAVPQENPYDALRRLGVKFKEAEPQMIADQIVFHDCENVPDEMPSSDWHKRTNA
jgi:hypothetical protein